MSWQLSEPENDVEFEPQGMLRKKAAPAGGAGAAWEYGWTDRLVRHLTITDHREVPVIQRSQRGGLVVMEKGISTD